MKVVNFIRRLLGIKKLQKTATDNNRLLKELNWADIFNNTIAGCTWLENQSFSPGRWGVGYPLLYVLYKALAITKPNSILEFGLGQSSNMLFRYAAEHVNVSVSTLEHDPQWIDFYKKDMPLPNNANIITVENETIKYKGAETLSIKHINKLLEGEKYDLVLVDAPFGSNRYSRSQVLSLIPENINPENFIIIIDDYSRPGEKETCNELEDMFTKHNINYRKGIYQGSNDLIIYCSDNLSFLTSM